MTQIWQMATELWLQPKLYAEAKNHRWAQTSQKHLLPSTT